jgi:hypothetical protein
MEDEKAQGIELGSLLNELLIEVQESSADIRDIRNTITQLVPDTSDRWFAERIGWWEGENE